MAILMMNPNEKHKQVCNKRETKYECQFEKTKFLMMGI